MNRMAYAFRFHEYVDDVIVMVTPVWNPSDEELAFLSFRWVVWQFVQMRVNYYNYHNRFDLLCKFQIVFALVRMNVVLGSASFVVS